MPAKKKKPPDIQIPPPPSPSEIVAHLDQYIVGQGEAKRTLATACYCHMDNCITSLDNGTMVWPDNNVLIAGPSGSGKSEMIRTLSDYLQIPHFQVDCTNLSPTGYKGRNLASVISDMEDHLVTDGLTPPTCIVTWDEIDKLQDDGTDAGEYRRMLQSDMLKLLEGTKVSETLDSTRILHIACGAFRGLDEIRTPTPKPTIGFTSEESQITSNSQGCPEPIQARHFIEFGLISEFVGRFTHLTTLDPLSRENMRDIMVASKISFLQRKIEHYKSHGAKLAFEDEAIDALAESALNHPSGARGLRQLLSKSLAPWDFKMSEFRSLGIREIHYDCQAIHDGNKARLVTANPIPERKKASHNPTEKAEAKPVKTLPDSDGEEDDDDFCIF